MASGVLAYEPLHWLVGTWLDPSYPTSGAVYLIALSGLLLWSLTSPVVETGSGEQHRRGAVGLLVVSALIRLAGQVLAVNVVGGVALGLDVFALAVLLRTGKRARPVSALWLAALFLFTLPVERIFQRIAGYPLQSLSADLSCGLLGLFFDDLACSGVRLQLAGQDVLVDLPCSGTAGLMLSLAFVTILHALYQPPADDCHAVDRGGPCLGHRRQCPAHFPAGGRARISGPRVRPECHGGTGAQPDRLWGAGPVTGAGVPVLPADCHADCRDGWRGRAGDGPEDRLSGIWSSGVRAVA